MPYLYVSLLLVFLRLCHCAFPPVILLSVRLSMSPGANRLTVDHDRDCLLLQTVSVPFILLWRLRHISSANYLTLAFAYGEPSFRPPKDITFTRIGRPRGRYAWNADVRAADVWRCCRCVFLMSLCGKYIASPACLRPSMLRCIVAATYVTTTSRRTSTPFLVRQSHTQTVALLSMHVPRGRRADGLPRSPLSTLYQTPGTNLTGRSHWYRRSRHVARVSLIDCARHSFFFGFGSVAAACSSAVSYGNWIRPSNVSYTRIFALPRCI